MSETDIAEARNGIQVIARAASVLRALKGSQTGLSLGQIAERVDLPRSTVQRIVGALQAERLVIASGAGSGIRLGPELHSLAESAHYNIAETIRPLLQDLSRETGETVDLSILRGNILIFIDQITGTQRLRAVSSVGETFPLTTTANGKACLSLMDNDEVERLARAEWARANVKRDMSDFLKQIAQIRGQDVAFDRDEHTPGISAVGIAFKDWKGDFYGVSIPTPSTRFKEGEASLTAAILQ
ncbi:MAG: IclR family transcriptional regulator, partial [Mesorhizobium sp.]